MPRMYGKMRVYPECRYGCCVYPKHKDSSKREEEKQWRTDAEEEMSDDSDS